MATSKKSLASRAGSAVRRAVRGRASTETSEEPVASSEAPATKAPAKKTTAKKTAAKKAPAKKTTAKKTTAKKAPAKKSTAKKSPATKAAPTAKKTPAKKTPATKAPAKKDPAKKTAATASSSSAARGQGPAALVVREGEESWTKAELDEVREHLEADVARLTTELETADSGLHDLMVDPGDGAGHDQADVGSSSFERDHGISIANNARDMLTQSQHALERIEDGSYGVCERDGAPIGKLRLMAFPRATLCLSCKQLEERR